MRRDIYDAIGCIAVPPFLLACVVAFWAVVGTLINWIGGHDTLVHTIAQEWKSLEGLCHRIW